MLTNHKRLSVSKRAFSWCANIRSRYRTEVGYRCKRKLKRVYSIETLVPDLFEGKGNVKHLSEERAICLMAVQHLTNAYVNLIPRKGTVSDTAVPPYLLRPLLVTRAMITKLPTPSYKWGYLVHHRLYSVSYLFVLVLLTCITELFWVYFVVSIKNDTINSFFLGYKLRCCSW